LLAFAAHGALTAPIPTDGGDCEQTLQKFASAGVDIDALALKLQLEGAASFVKSWNDLMAVIDSKSHALKHEPSMAL